MRDLLLDTGAIAPAPRDDASPAIGVPGKTTRTEKVQRFARGTGSVPAFVHAPASGGASLPAPVQAKMGDAFGADFSDVRVHQDGQAEAAGAQAYATGNDLHFAAGAYDPGSPSGQVLIAHELTHVVQQRGGRVGGDGVVVDGGLEREADDHGARAVRGERVGGGGGASTRGPVQGAGLSPDQDRDADGKPDAVSVPIERKLRGAGGGASTSTSRWGLQEPLLPHLVGDLPLVDVSAGVATATVSAGSYGSFSLDDAGHFKLGVKSGGASASTDGKTASVGVNLGAVSGSVDASGTATASGSVGPFTLSGDTIGKATLSLIGVSMTYDGATGDVTTSFTPELDWKWAKLKLTSATPTSITLVATLTVDLGGGWSVAIAQSYTLVKTVTDADAERALTEVLDPITALVTGGAGTFSDLLRALGGS